MSILRYVIGLLLKSGYLILDRRQIDVHDFISSAVNFIVRGGLQVAGIEYPLKLFAITEQPLGILHTYYLFICMHKIGQAAFNIALPLQS